MIQFKAKLQYAGAGYEFDLCSRQIDMPPHGPITYCWMPLPGLRQPGGGPNVAACVDLWWAETQQQHFTNPEDELDAEVNLALAELYPLVVSSRSTQNVFVDALLRRLQRSNTPPRHAAATGPTGAEEEDGELDGRGYVLPDAEWRRLRDMARRRDLHGIEQEIKDQFVGDLPPQQEMPAYRKAFGQWMTNAVVELHRNGRSGLRSFLKQKLLAQIRSYRRRGGQARVRTFINMVAYEAAVGFRTCYAKAWGKLTPWLMMKRGLDPTSARFLSLWHSQNSLENGRDAFWGHVLALHPLSERIMTQAHHRAAVGTWLVQAASDPLGGPIVDRDAYWDLVATILAAGREYVALRERQNLARRLPSQPAGVVDIGEVVAPVGDRHLIAEKFDEFASAQLLDCPECSGKVAFVGHELLSESGRPALRIEYACTRCHRRNTTDLDCHPGSGGLGG